MATYTTNFNLKKPTGGENSLIADISGNMDLIDAALENIFEMIGIVQNTDNATQAIDEGSFVAWKGKLYTASTDIAIGDAFEISTNLASVANGGFNNLIGFSIRSVTHTYTVDTNSYVAANLKTLIEADLPEGKTCYGIVGFNSGHSAAVIASAFYSPYGDGTASLKIRNIGSSKLSSKTATIYYLAV